MSTQKPIQLEVLQGFQTPRNHGALDRWDGHARITGPCGDTMEYWLQIAEGRILRANFTTTGCGSSRAAGSMAAELVVGRSLPEAARLGQQDVLQALGGLPKESEHCALLAANTLKAAIGDYEARQQADPQRGECSGVS